MGSVALGHHLCLLPHAHAGEAQTLDCAPQMTKEEYHSVGSVALGERLVERLRAAGRRP